MYCVKLVILKEFFLYSTFHKVVQTISSSLALNLIYATRKINMYPAHIEINYFIAINNYLPILLTRKLHYEF